MPSVAVCHALLGENGAGKSTLIKILAGAYQADSGEILYNGSRYTHLSTRQALDNGIRVIYQELNLLPDMSVAENIFLGHEPSSRLGVVNRTQMKGRSVALLAQLGVASNPARRCGELDCGRPTDG